MQSVPTVEPGEPMLRASRARALRIAPMLALLVGAGLFFSRPAEPPPSDIKLAIGKPFVQGIISLFDMKVDNILLQKPESQWSHFAVGMLAFDLLVDIHMELLFFGAQATLASAEMDLSFRGERFGTLSTRPCPLGGGGKIKTQMAGQLVVDDLDAFQKISRAVVHEDEFTVELSSVVTVELRGTDNGCILRKDMCKTVGSARIPGAAATLTSHTECLRCTPPLSTLPRPVTRKQRPPPISPRPISYATALLASHPLVTRYARCNLPHRQAGHLDFARCNLRTRDAISPRRHLCKVGPSQGRARLQRPDGRPQAHRPPRDRAGRQGAHLGGRQGRQPLLLRAARPRRHVYRHLHGRLVA
mmetsp:Transcript_12187/g.40755  ORF Transcript_12187/g.40755 Transcript_12187/m.40755 type:complete len:359 (+) Transcript_12187:43-1119(+)